MLCIHVTYDYSQLSSAVVHVQGIRNVPTKLRIQISRKRNDDEDAKVRLVSLSYSVSLVPLALAKI